MKIGISYNDLKEIIKGKISLDGMVNFKQKIFERDEQIHLKMMNL